MLLEQRDLVVDGFQARHALAVDARPLHEVHLDAGFGLKAELRQLQLRDGFGGEPGRELIEHGQLDPDLAAPMRRGALIALLAQDIEGSVLPSGRSALASISDCTCCESISSRFTSMNKRFGAAYASSTAGGSG